MNGFCYDFRTVDERADDLALELHLDGDCGEDCPICAEEGEGETVDVGQETDRKIA